MDSAFLHARALFEFFVIKKTKNHYSSTQFLLEHLHSDSYENDWSESLHSYLMHIRDRSHPVPLKSSGGQKDLNQMPVDFAHEILRLWEEFERKLGESSAAEDQKLGKLAREKRKEAIDGAQCVVESNVAQRHAQERGQVLKPVFVFSI